MKKRGWEDKRLAAALMTLFIIGTLLFSGPARAITLGIERTDGSANPTEGEVLSFQGKVDLHTTDAISLKEVVVIIDPTPSDSLTNGHRCRFHLNGSAFSGNPAICDITVGSISSDYSGPTYGTGDAYGYAYKFATGVANTSNFTFNAGYQYGYQAGYGYDVYNTSLGSTAEIVMNFSWTAPSVSSDTEYKIALGVVAGESDTDDQVLFLSGDTIGLTVRNRASGGGGTTTTILNSSGSVGTSGSTTVVKTSLDVIPEIKLISNEPIADATIQVEEVAELGPDESGFVIGTPVQAGKVKTVYKYIRITPSSDVMEKTTSAKIEFTVDKSWLEENGLELSDVVLLRFHDGEWTPLPTTYIGFSDGKYTFSSTTPGFSLFAVGVRQAALIPSTSTTTTTPVTGDVCLNEVTFAIDPGTKDCYKFPSTCDVPAGWNVVDACPSAKQPPKVVTPGLAPNEKLAVFLGVVVMVLLVIWLFVYRRPGPSNLPIKKKKAKKPKHHKKKPHMLTFSY